jgi:transmembrane sensor
LNLLALWEDAQLYDQQRRLDVDRLIDLAREDRSVTDIAVRPRQVPRSRDTPLSRLLRPRTAIAALLSLVVNCAVIWMALNSRSEDYRTQLAEQRSVVLSDGSHVELDALSNLRVSFSKGERTVELLSGQALFHVTKDARRPFVVRVDGARLRAVGTVFDVDRTVRGTVLTVLEGRVAALGPQGVGNHSGGAGIEVKVDAGEQARLTPGTITTPQAVDTVAVTGWTRSLLIFAATPLAVAAEEFNRFNLRRLVVADPELSVWPVTGTFRALDPQTLADFVLFLRQQPGIEVFETTDRITVRMQRR